MKLDDVEFERAARDFVAGMPAPIPVDAAFSVARRDGADAIGVFTYAIAGIKVTKAVACRDGRVSDDGILYDPWDETFSLQQAYA